MPDVKTLLSEIVELFEHLKMPPVEVNGVEYRGTYSTMIGMYTKPDGMKVHYSFPDLIKRARAIIEAPDTTDEQ